MMQRGRLVSAFCTLLDILKILCGPINMEDDYEA